MGLYEAFAVFMTFGRFIFYYSASVWSKCLHTLFRLRITECL